ncbi:MAG: hypothetical protein PVH87_24975 [Desulfobacteraceae bacterium]|jgi:hypothetical protein
MASKDERLFEIACTFPALRHKGVEKGNIPGINSNDFYDLDLAEYLYNGRGGVLSHGEFLILEALLNLCNPDLHDKFNLGEALYVLDERNMQALLNAIVRTYNRT